MFNSKPQLGLLILRLGLAIVFLWFGFSQLFASASWVSWVPDWAMSLTQLDALMIVKLNGALEVLLGSLLALNIYSRIVSLVLALHLALITLEIGYSPTGVRDLGLTLATFAFFYLTPSNATWPNAESSDHA